MMSVTRALADIGWKGEICLVVGCSDARDKPPKSTPPAAKAPVGDVCVALVEKLPDGYRTVLLLRDIEEFDTEQTASALGLTKAAVKTRLHRARQALHQLLDEHFRLENPEKGRTEASEHGDSG